MNAFRAVLKERHHWHDRHSQSLQTSTLNFEAAFHPDPTMRTPDPSTMRRARVGERLNSRRRRTGGDERQSLALAPDRRAINRLDVRFAIPLGIGMRTSFGQLRIDSRHTDRGGRSTARVNDASFAGTAYGAPGDLAPVISALFDGETE